MSEGRDEWKEESKGGMKWKDWRNEKKRKVDDAVASRQGRATDVLHQKKSNIQHKKTEIGDFFRQN